MICCNDKTGAREGTSSATSNLSSGKREKLIKEKVKEKDACEM